MNNRMTSYVLVLCGVLVLGLGLFSRVPFQEHTQVAQVGDISSTSCALGAVQWPSAGTYQCEAYITAAGYPGMQPMSVTDMTGPTTGSAQFECTSEGVWRVRSGATCLNAPGYCPGGKEVRWSDQGNDCVGRTTTTSGTGVVQTVRDDSGPEIGQATFTCNNDGTWSSEPTSKYCVMSTNTTCPTGKTIEWSGSDGSMCRGVIETSGAPSTSGTVQNSTTDATGVATVQCGPDGMWNVLSSASTCSLLQAEAPPTVYCPSTTLSWTTSNGACVGVVNKTLSGTIASVVTMNTGVSGTATFLCRSDGTWDTSPKSKECTTVNDTSTSTNTDVDALTTPVPSTTSLAYCPIQKKTGRIIIDFTNGGNTKVSNLLIYAHGDVSAARTTSQDVYLIPGTYEVRFASQRPSTSTRTSNEVWNAVLYGKDGSEIMVTQPSTDIPDWWDDKPYPSKLSSNLMLAQEARKVRGMHGAFGDSLGNPVAPLCVSFERVPTEPIATSDTNMLIASSTTLIRQVTPEAPTTRAESPTLLPTVTVAPLKTFAQQSSVETQPEIIGIASIANDIIVPPEVLERRKRIVEEYERPPLELLQQATPREREALVHKLLSTTTPSAHDEDDGISSTTTRRLTRVSREEERHDGGGVVSSDSESYEQPAIDVITKRSGLIALRDTDGDGITDYDEKYLYGTDPDNPFTGGSTLSDGERVIVGLNPLENSIETVLVDSPRYGGATVSNIFTVDTIRVATVTPETERSTSDEQRVYVRGRAQPYSFVTLYIYSTPIIITVQADVTGKFEYTFDTTLEDGTHELYVTSVNSTGKILAKTEPIPFIKTAQAIEYTPASPPANPVDDSMQYMITFALLASLIVAVGTTIMLGMHHARHEDVLAQQHHDTSVL